MRSAPPGSAPMNDFWDGGACMLTSFDGSYAGALRVNTAFQQIIPTISAGTAVFWRSHSGCRTNLLDPGRFLNRLGPDLILILPPRSAAAKRGGDGIERDCEIGAFSSNRKFQSPFTPCPRAADCSACGHALRLRQQAAATGSSR